MAPPVRFQKINKALVISSTKASAVRGILVGVVSFLVIYFFWSAYNEQQQKQINEELELRGKFLHSQIEELIHQNILSLDHLAQRIEFSQGEYYQNWKNDARLMIEMHPSIQFLEVIDSQMIIQDVYPEMPNQKVRGIDIGVIDYRAVSWLENTADTNLNISSWLHLIQGGDAFLMDAPLYYNNRFHGTVTGGFNFTEELNTILSGLEQFSVELYDDAGNKFYHYPDTSTTSVFLKEPFTIQIQPHHNSDKVWKMQMAFVDYQKSDKARLASLLTLFLGLVASILAGIIVFSLGRVQVVNIRVKEFNKKLVRANHELKTERKNAEKASRSKTDFLSTMSHEMRTPLNAILGFLSLLRKEKLNQVAQEYVDIMEVSSKSLLSLINDVLDIDKIESGKLVLEHKSFHPTQELSDLLKTFEPEFKAKGLELRKNFDRVEALPVKGDVGKFIQIFTNLIRNSFKFTDYGFVEVRYHQKQVDQTVVITIEIEDSGIGIPSNRLETIFERFSQIDSGKKRKYEGSGLGLTICKNLVKLMDGKISVQSTIGRGSTFTVEVKLEKSNELSVGTESISTKQDNFRGARVLIAEDNILNQMLLRKILQQHSIDAEVANNGLEALEMVKNYDFDLIFMDLHMPEMDGLEATAQLIESGFKAPIVALTADVTPESMEASKTAGMVDYITKPIDQQRLKKVLNKYL